MSCDSLNAILDWSSPLVAAAELAIGLWVVQRLRGTSKDVQSTSQVAELNSLLLHRLLGRNVSAPAAPDLKRSSTRGTTSTSPGDPSDDESRP